MIITQVGHRLKCKRQNIAGPAPSPAPAPSPYVFTKIADPAVTLSGTGSELNPWTIQQMMDNAVAGDIVGIKPGAHVIPQKNFGDSYTNYYAPINSGTALNPIIFAAYDPNNRPVFDGTTGGTGDPGGTNGPIAERMIGVSHLNSYITFDGLILQCEGGIKMASMIIGDNTIGANGTWTCHDIVLKNIKLNGGSTIHTGTDNAEGMRIEESYNVTVQNCEFYNYRESTNYHNTSAIKTYDNHDLIFLNNYFHDNTVGPYFKRQTNNITFYRNFLDNNYLSIFDNPGSSAYSMSYHDYYDNLIINFDYQGLQVLTEGGYQSLYFNIYNNTSYSASANVNIGLCDGTNGVGTSVVSHNIHSNIMLIPNLNIGINKSIMRTPYGPSGLIECDYNQFGNGPFNNRKNIDGGTTVYYTSLAAWQVSGALGNGGNPDLNSLASDPQFVNGSGFYNSITDFSLGAGSPCIGTGKAGVNMGCNTTLVGLQ